jgi:hypothetical protein
MSLRPGAVQLVASSKPGEIKITIERWKQNFFFLISKFATGEK